MEINYRIALFMACLLAFALLAYGFVFGFGAFLSLAAGFALLCWQWARFIRRQTRGVYEWQQFGYGVYRMEIA